MIWQNPLSWFGLAALLLPVIIHLLGRGRSSVVRFPSLRFIGASRLLPARRTRVHQWLLLAVRLAILFAATAALAQPLVGTAGRRRALDQSLARVVIIDTSRSVQDVAAVRRDAARVAAEAQSATVIESDRPGRELSGAAEWLAQQAGRPEIVVFSDFQLGSVRAPDVAQVPASVGLRMVRVARTSLADRFVLRHRQGTRNVVASTGVDSTATDVVWQVESAPGAAVLPRLLTADDETGAAADAAAAAVAVGIPVALDTLRPVAILFARAAGRAQLLDSAAPLRTPWMIELALRLHSDALLSAAASDAVVSSASMPAAGFPVASNNTGESVVRAVEVQDGARAKLLLVIRSDLRSPVSAALIAATARALSTTSPTGEQEPLMVPDSTLARWQHPAPASATMRGSLDPDRRDSDGRWLWALALVFLIVEGVLRRSAPPLAVSHVE